MTCVDPTVRGPRECQLAVLFGMGIKTVRMSNVHERRIAVPAALVGALLDTLASSDDRFWPHENWPAIGFDRPLQVGATGGHGTGPYTITSYTPGKHIRFEFGGARDGYHEFTLQETGYGACLQRHTTKARLAIKSAYRWYVQIRPLHNALIACAGRGARDHRGWNALHSIRRPGASRHCTHCRIPDRTHDRSRTGAAAIGYAGIH